MKAKQIIMCLAVLTIVGCGSEDVDTAVNIADAIESDKDRDEIIEQLEEINERNDETPVVNEQTSDQSRQENTSPKKEEILNNYIRINNLVEERQQISTALIFANNTDSFGNQSFQKIYASSCETRERTSQNDLDNIAENGAIRGSFLCTPDSETGKPECLYTTANNFQLDAIVDETRFNVLADRTREKSFTVGSISNPTSDTPTVSNGIVIVLASFADCDENYNGFQRKDDLIGNYSSELYSIDTDGTFTKLSDLAFSCDTNGCSGDQIEIDVVAEQTSDNGEGFFYAVDFEFSFGSFPGGILLTPETNDSLGAAWCDASQRSDAFKNSCFFIKAEKL